MKQNTLVTIIIVIAICLVAVVFAYSAYSHTLPLSRAIVPVATPVETIPPTPEPTVITPVPTSTYAYLDYIQAGTTKVTQAKTAMNNGMNQMIVPLSVQTNTVEITNVLYATKQNFTDARDLFKGAQADYTHALTTAPASQVASINTLISVLNSDQRNAESFMSSVDYALAYRWFDSNSAYNQAKLLYQANMDSTNQLLTAMNFVS